MKKQVFVGDLVRPLLLGITVQTHFLTIVHNISCQYFNVLPFLSYITAISVSKMAKWNNLPASHQGLQSTPAKLLAAVNTTASAIAPHILEYVPNAGLVGLLFCCALVLAATGH